MTIPATLAWQDASPLGSGELPAGATSQPGTTGAPGTPPPSQGGPDLFILVVLGMSIFLVMMIFTGGRRQKREQKTRQAMLDALKRNDKVQTIGGIIGTVAEVRTDEVVLKVDDAGHNKIRFARSAIQQVISSRGGPADATSTAENHADEPQAAHS
ncbi:MAG: preprotein translocase subunit YajC [Phycisphaeraceae bacterium]|nr:preprotein translocase subunit YajC [Phycisphaeraceae bacterium]